MAVVVQDLATQALTSLGVLAEAEVPTTSASNDALDALNGLFDQWKAERLIIYQLLNTTKAITPSVGNYSVGLPAGDIPIERPMFIDHAAWIDSSSPNHYYDLIRLTDDAWSSITIPNLTATLPQYWWYQTTFPLSRVWLWPIPTSSGIFISLDYQSAVGEFAALTTAVSLPPGYRRMIVTNLALELAPSYGVQPSGLLVQHAEDSMAAVKRANYKLSDLSVDPGALIGNGGGGWSIYEGP